jgi:hypothetical protein
MRLAILVGVFCLAAWPSSASLIETAPAQWSWPPFETSAHIAPSSNTMPTVLVSAAQYGAGLTDDLVHDPDGAVVRAAFESALMPAPHSKGTMRVIADRPRVPIEDVCDALIASAHRHDLPVRFFIRLIWQESKFNPQAVSPVGAQGVAQFMPQTANDMGLDDPFDPIRAVQASARLLRDLIEQFGNVGLAAAAYNAGPKRIVDWLQKRVRLPEETRNYVLSITGHAADSWRRTKPGKLALAVPKRAPCQADADYAAVVEVPAPPPPPTPKPKPHGKHVVVASHAAKGRGATTQKSERTAKHQPSHSHTREQIVIDVAHHHPGSSPKITIMAAEPGPHKRSAKTAKPSTHGRIRLTSR